VRITVFREETTLAFAGFHAGPIGIWSCTVGFCGGRKTRGPREKPLEQGNNQQTYPHMALGPAQAQAL